MRSLGLDFFGLGFGGFLTFRVYVRCRALGSGFGVWGLGFRGLQACGQQAKKADGFRLLFYELLVL